MFFPSLGGLENSTMNGSTSTFHLDPWESTWIPGADPKEEMTKILWDAGAENMPNDRGFMPDAWMLLVGPMGQGLQGPGAEPGARLAEWWSRIWGSGGLNVWWIWGTNIAGNKWQTILLHVCCCFFIGSCVFLGFRGPANSTEFGCELPHAGTLLLPTPESC